jgi:hypothetical protein
MDPNDPNTSLAILQEHITFLREMLNDQNNSYKKLLEEEKVKSATAQADLTDSTVYLEMLRSIKRIVNSDMDSDEACKALSNMLEGVET